MAVDLLANGSFKLPWTNLLPYGGRLTNQQPAGFALTIRMPGTRLLSADAGITDDPPVYTDVVSVPECVHKLRSQLPDADLLILDGDVTFKAFAATNPFSLDLTAMVVFPAAGTCAIEVPVQVHQHGDGSPGAAVWQLIVNDVAESWRTFGRGFVDRTWATAYRTVRQCAGTVLSVTARMESAALAGVDFFSDRWRVIFTPEAESICPASRGLPRVPYARRYWLLPQAATLEEAHAVLDLAYPSLGTVGYSADDAGIGDLDERQVEVIETPTAAYDETALRSFFGEHYPGVDVGWVVLDPDGEEPEEPEPEPWIPARYVLTGTVGGFHGSQGDDGQLNVFRDCAAAGVSLPTGKMVTTQGAAAELKAYQPSAKLIGRRIDFPGVGNVEGYRFDLDPIWQADVRMATLLPTMLANPAVDYWEFINEQKPATPEGARDQAQFCIRCMDIAEDAGVHLAFFSDSVGTPEFWAWVARAETGIFERIADGGHALALHEYGCVGESWVIGRFAEVYERIILPKKLNIPLFVTEYGVRREDLARGADWVWSQFVQYDQMCAKYTYFAGFHAYIGPQGDSAYKTMYSGLEARFTQYAINIMERVNG
jgi:hypothetical protein